MLTESRCVPLAWALCGCYVGPFMSVLGLCWPSLAACTAGHPAETQFRKELPDRGTGTKPAHLIDFVAAGAGAQELVSRPALAVLAVQNGQQAAYVALCGRHGHYVALCY